MAEPRQPRQPGAAESQRAEARDPGKKKGGKRRKVPPADKRAQELGKRFMMPGQPALVATLSEGQVAERYAPAEIAGRFIASIGSLLGDFGGGYQPMLWGATGGGSLQLVFGDADPLGSQSQLALENTQTQAERVAELIELEGDKLWKQAVRIGPAVRRYNELVQLVGAEGIRLEWTVREHGSHTLTAERAQHQHTRLTQRPKTKDRPMTVNGVLYRVLTESTAREEFLGSVGIHLHAWSLLPPRAKKGARLLAYYEDPAVHQKIRDRLVGESVAAELALRQPEIGSTYEPERFDLILKDIEAAPATDPLLGPSLLDEGEDDEAEAT